MQYKFTSYFYTALFAILIGNLTKIMSHAFEPIYEFNILFESISVIILFFCTSNRWFAYLCASITLAVHNFWFIPIGTALGFPQYYEYKPITALLLYLWYVLLTIFIHFALRIFLMLIKRISPWYSS